MACVVLTMTTPSLPYLCCKSQLEFFEAARALGLVGVGRFSLP